MTDLAGLPASVRAVLHDEAVPDWRTPTLATLTDKRFSDPGWIYERKLDGMRCLAFRDGDRVRLLSRNRQRLNGTYPELVDALATQRESRFVLDGEVVAFEDAAPPSPGCRAAWASPTPRLPGLRESASPITSSTCCTSTASPPWTCRLIWRKRLLRSTIEFADPLRYTPRTASPTDWPPTGRPANGATKG